MRKRLAFMLLAFGCSAQATVIDFEEFPEGLTNGALVSQGFVLDPGDVDWYASWSGSDWIGHHHLIDPETHGGWYVYNGTKYFAFDYFRDRSILNVYAASGATFGLQQFDLAEQGAGGTCEFGATHALHTAYCTVAITGLLAGGGTVSTSFVLDALYDGTGPMNDFQTITFDEQWSNLTMFTIAARYEYLNPGLDNLILIDVPEPSSLWLFALGLMGAGVVRIRRRVGLQTIQERA